MKFFSEQELSSYEDHVAKGCLKCGLDKKCKHPKMRVSGKGKTGTLIVGEYPGKMDDELGRPFMGNANVEFLNLLRKKGFNPFEDFYFTNAVNCWKPSKDGKKVDPTDSEIKNCRPYVESIVAELRPRNIIILGNSGVKSFFPFVPKANVEMLRGFQIPDQKTKVWFHTTISPRTIDAESFNKNLKSVYERDIDSIFKKLNTPFVEYPEPKIRMLYSINEIVAELEYILNLKTPLYIDYETTGLKPFYNGHRVVSMSIAYRQKGIVSTVSFPYQYRSFFTDAEQKKIKYHIKKILVSGVPLSAHNLKFEDSWSRNVLGMKPKNWVFDTQIAAHILDNRKGITGLKQQVYLNFGIRPYNEKVAPLLERVEGSEFNRVDDIPLDELLYYGGLDSYYGLILGLKQEKELVDRNLTGPYNFFHQGTLLLSNMQQRGIYMDEEYYHEQDKILETKIKDIEAGLMESREARLFKKKTNKDIDLASGKDLGVLFYDIMKTKKVFTSKGNLSVDKITLDKIKNPFVTQLLYLRKLEKAKNTYFAQFLREIYNGRMNPFFSLNIPVSFRSSSQEPNFQNISTRDDEIKKLIRSGVKASPGNQLLFFDGAGMEVRAAAIVNKDPNLIKYINDPTTDMHRETSQNIWMLPKEEITKEIRFYAKNQFVFATFYGSWYKDTGTHLWETCIDQLNLKTKSDVPLKQHLKDNGIANLNAFLEHCKSVEDIFWNQRFKVYSQWKNEIVKEYQAKGFVTNPLGFVFSGIMNKKQLSNYPIQSLAFHLLLWILLELENILTKQKMKSFMIAQIHDEGILDIVPEEKNEIISIVKDLCSVKLPQQFPWINVPILMDFSITPINGNWYEKEEM